MIFSFSFAIYYKVIKEYVLYKTSSNLDLYYTITYISFKLINRFFLIQEDVYQNKITAFAIKYKCEMNNILSLKTKVCNLMKNQGDQNEDNKYESMIISMI